MCLHIVLRHALAFAVHGAEVELGVGEALLGSEPVNGLAPVRCQFGCQLLRCGMIVQGGEHAGAYC